MPFRTLRSVAIIQTQNVPLGQNRIKKLVEFVMP